MNLSPAVARQYLKAMGIESWEPRDAAPALATAVDAATPEHMSSQGGRIAAQGNSVCQSGVESFLQNLSDQPVQTINIVDAKMLLLLESPKLEAGGQELLKSMLKAINVEFDAQAFGYLGSAEQATGNVRSFVGNVQPSIVIVMANLLQGIDDLAQHRASLHRLPWIDAPVAVTMHPNVLIDNPALKRPAWEDLKRVKAFLDR